MASCSSVSEIDKAPVNNKRRSVNEKDMKRKILKNSGQSYVSSRGKGKVVDEKKPPSTARDCSSNCTKPGCKSLALSSVHALHKRFYQLDYNQQTLVLIKCITMHEPKRRRTGKSDENSRRSVSCDYAINGQAVCIKTLCNVFSITPQRIHQLLIKLKSGESAPKDKRGSHSNRPHATNADVRQRMRDHMGSFLCSDTGSTSSSSLADFNVKKMYNQFREKYPEDVISCTLYRRMFKTVFNLQFGTARDDTCEDENQTNSMELESAIHQLNADPASATLAADLDLENCITVSVDVQPVNNKKRSVNISERKDNKRKILKNSGQSYVSSRGKGKVVDEKKPPSTARGCSSNCTKPGCKSLTQPTVHYLHKKFYQLDYNKQTLMLAKCMTFREPKRRRPGKSGENSRRSVSCFYAIRGKAVCIKTLCNVFSITQQRIHQLLIKLKSGESAPKDKRGSHSNRPHATDANVRQNIIDHINSFPSEMNHYTGNMSSKQCLSPRLNVQKMYDLFKEKYPQDKISCTVYRRIFKADFNLQFGTPRSGTCQECVNNYSKLVTACNENQRSSAELKSAAHHTDADPAYATLAEDLDDQSCITICVDLQQVLFTPMLTHSDMYYQRQYSSYNLSIHNMNFDQSLMFLWHESVAKCGEKEIGSCLLKYVTGTFETLQPGQERKLIVWSNPCVEKINNLSVLNLYSYFVRSGFFTEIHQKLTTTGHSFHPCDRDFALIDNAVKKHKPLVPSDLRYIISSAKQINPFVVIEMNQDDFKDLDFISKGMKKKFQLAKFVWFKLSADDPTSLYARESHDTLRPWASQRVFPVKNVRRGFDELPRLYFAPVPISKEKKADLMDMTRYLANPEHRSFYENLLAV